MESALPNGIFLSGRSLWRRVCISLKHVQVNVKSQGFYYFEYADSYFCVVYSTACVSWCQTAIYKSANFMVGALQKCCANHGLLKAH